MSSMPKTGRTSSHVFVFSLRTRIKNGSIDITYGNITGELFLWLFVMFGTGQKKRALYLEL